MVYLAGLGRSGSTLLERLLGEMPGACPAGEVVHMWLRGVRDDERCGCGQPFGSCPFWQQVGQAAFGGWDRVDVDRVTRLRAQVDRTRFLPAARLGRGAAGASPAWRVRGLLPARSTPRSPGQRQPGGHRLQQARLARVLPALAAPDWTCGSSTWSGTAARSPTPGARGPAAGAAGSQMATYSPAGAAAPWNLQNSALQLLAQLGTPACGCGTRTSPRARAATLARSPAFAGLPGGAAYRFLGTDGTRRWAELGPRTPRPGNPMRFTTGRVPIRRTSAGGPRCWPAAGARSPR